MHKINVDKLLGKNPPRRRKILLEFAKQPSGVANKVMAETLQIDHSNLVSQHLSAFEKFGVIRKCDVVVKRPMGRVRTPTEISMKGYRLNYDTFATLLNIFVGTDHLEDFLDSPYVNEMDDLGTVFQIVINTISDHMEPVQSLVGMFGLPSTRESLAAHVSQMMSNIMANLVHARDVWSTMPPHSTFADLRRKLDEERP